MSNDAPRWELVTAWSLRVALVLTAIAFFVKGELAFGIFCTVAVAVVVTPQLVSREAKLMWPVELEIILLFLVTAHTSVGYLFGLYDEVSFFDKGLHFIDSALIGFVAFLIVYVAHFIRHDRSHPWIDGIAIFFITLGLGALWEIAEFASDQLFGAHTQGSPNMSPLADTMWDLIVDGGGGVLAAVIGPLYMHASKRSRERVKEYARRLEAHEARS